MGKVLGFITGSTSATKKAVKAANYAADQNASVAKQGLDAITSRIDPYAGAGVGASGIYNDIIGLPQAPGSTVQAGAGETAFQNYLHNFGFDRELEQGSQAIRGNMASRRLLGSGATLKALQRYGLGLRDDYRGNFLNAVGNQQALGVNAAGALSGATTNYTGQITNNNNNRASVIGNAALAGAASNTNFLGAGLSAAAMLSDRRAKKDIKRIGKLNDGTGVYSYTYKGSDTPQVGVMAQEIERKHPKAVTMGDDGFRRVNYLQLIKEAA